MNLLEILNKTGKGIKTAAIDTEKGLAIAGKATVHELPEVAEIAVEVAPFIPVPFLSPVLRTAQAAAQLVAPRPAPVSSEFLPASLPVAKGMSQVFQTSITGDKMNPLESFGITMVLGILQSVIKNPAHKAVLETQLVGVADQIYMTYGMVPPAPAATAAPSIAGH